MVKYNTDSEYNEIVLLQKYKAEVFRVFLSHYLKLRPGNRRS